jgi:hypothetical protein
MFKVYLPYNEGHLAWSWKLLPYHIIHVQCPDRHLLSLHILLACTVEYLPCPVRLRTCPGDIYRVQGDIKHIMGDLVNVYLGHETRHWRNCPCTWMILPCL